MTGPEARWMIHGVVRAGAPRPRGAPKHSRAVFGGLAALLSPGHVADASNPRGAAAADAALLEREAVAALAHNALLTCYAVETDVAPIRYGAAATGPAAAPALLGRDSGHYCEVLDRVAGAVEYALRLVAEPGAPGAPPLAHEPLLAAQPDRSRPLELLDAARTACVASLRREMAALAREQNVMPVPPDRFLDLAVLIPRARVGDLAAAVERAGARAARCGMALELIGPWPPYSFTCTRHGATVRRTAP